MVECVYSHLTSRNIVINKLQHRATFVEQQMSHDVELYATSLRPFNE